jgi:glutaredoxin 3
MSSFVRIYTTRVCGYCARAKRLFADKGVPFEEIDVTSDPEKREWLVQVTGMRTVPQIFIGDRPYGGFTDVYALEQSGELDALLAARPSDES